MYRCPVCSQSQTKVKHHKVRSVYSEKTFDILQCKSCGHFFTEPVFTNKELNDIYTTRYSYDAHSLIEREKKMRAKKYAQLIANLKGVKSALEVGCMHGLLLTELKNAGIKVSGVELDKEAVEYCQRQGLDVMHSTIEKHLEKTNSKHDAIIMSHVIEHIANPLKQLKALQKRMQQKGKLVLVTPNSEAATRSLFGRYWGYWQVPVHINHFNPGSMQTLLEHAGFKTLEQKKFGGDSLFFLSTLANVVGASNTAKTLTPVKRGVVRTSSLILKPWYFLGSEDLVVVAEKS